MLQSYSGWFDFRVQPRGYVKMFTFVFLGYLLSIFFRQANLLDK